MLVQTLGQHGVPDGVAALAGGEVAGGDASAALRLRAAVGQVAGWVEDVAARHLQAGQQLAVDFQLQLLAARFADYFARIFR